MGRGASFSGKARPGVETGTAAALRRRQRGRAGRNCHLALRERVRRGIAAMAASHALAQREQMSVGDQPGLIPDPEDERLSPQFQRQVVLYRSSESPGTIIVHTSERFLYVVQPNGRALRYGIGVGRDGFQWQGLLRITRKQEWPDWTPPPEMIQRQPYLPRFMAGGPGNPMGARALYLGSDGLSHSRHQSAADYRQRGLVRMLSPGQWRRDRPVRSNSGRDQGRSFGRSRSCDQAMPS